MVVTNASTEDWRTLSGHGHVSLRDGLLWDIPIISILSPVLNTVSPGLGNSRATEAAARFRDHQPADFFRLAGNPLDDDAAGICRDD